MRALAVLALGVVPAACARREPTYEHAVLPLVLRLDGAELDVEAEPAAEAAVDEVSWVSDGLAGVVVRLRGPDAAIEQAGKLRIRRWPLAPPPAAGSGAPELLDLPIPELDAEARRSGTPNAGWWVEDGELAVLAPADKAVPDVLRIRYAVHAAHLAGTEHGERYLVRDLCAARLRSGGRSTDAIAVPTGATLRWTLPPLPDGRLAGTLTAIPADPGQSVQVELLLAGEPLFEGVVPAGAAPIGIGRDGRRSTEIPASPRSRALELVARGAPGGLVLLETPLWTRPRSWRDGPNVILIVVDGLRADRIGVPGDSDGVTPALDRFALDAVRFQDAWSTSSWCLPALASILTSTYVTEHQVTAPGRTLDGGPTTAAEIFRAAGFRTHAITDGGYATPASGLDRGFGSYDATADGVADVVARARAFLAEEGDSPYFLLLHTAACTGPYQPPPDVEADLRRRYPEALGDRPADPAAYVALARAGRPAPAGVVQALRELYDAELHAVDAELGTLLAELRERSDWRDGFVVAITATHGEELGEHGFLGHGTTLYPEVVRVPLLVKLPRGERASIEIHDAVSLVDLAPTLVQAAELGRSLPAARFTGVPLLSGLERSAVHAALEHPEGGSLAALRHDEYLLIRGRHAYPAVRPAAAVQLYDLAVDPDAAHDFARSQRAGAQVLSHRLQQFPERHPPRVPVAATPDEIR